jgi:hypothetical protein
MQQFHMFWSENNEKDAHTGEVTGRPTETFDKAHLDWICPRHKDDRDRFWSLPLRQMRMGRRMPKSRPHYGSPIQPQGTAGDRSDHLLNGIRYLCPALRQSWFPSVVIDRKPPMNPGMD